MYKIYIVRKKDISNCTYNMVDLGLSVKWADRNVGATSPEHYGSYFQWGDTNAYTFDGAGEVTAAELAKMLNPLLSPELGMEITADNVGAILEQMGMTSTDLTSTGLVLDKEFCWNSYFDANMNKYNNQGGLTALESSDDATTIHMGSQYRMPTMEEILELIINTTQTFIDLDGNEFSKEYAENGSIESEKLKGVRFTGSNGNSIFMPAGGYCDNALLGGIGSAGCLWSSSLSGGKGEEAKCLGFDDVGDVYESSDGRYRGQSVRGVQA